MMLYPALTLLTENISNRYLLVNVVARRARQIADTADANGISLEDTVKIAPLFEDPNEVVVRSGEGVRKYQEANIFKTEKAVDESRPFPDVSDQTENSPNING